MKLKNANIKNGLNILILVGAITGISWVIGMFYKDSAEQKNFRLERIKFIKIIDKANNATTSEQLENYCDTCRKYIKRSSSYEIDSLKLFTVFYIKCGDDVCRDVANSIKDNGTMDTSTMLQPATILESVQVCLRCGKNYPRWKNNINHWGMMSQQKRDSMVDVGNPAENTRLCKERILHDRSRSDSIFRLFYDKVFADEKTTKDDNF